MLHVIPIFIFVCTFQTSTSASADGEGCTTSSNCLVGSTCYRGFCTPGLNGLPCNNTSDCIATAECFDSDDLDGDSFCFRLSSCLTSKDCLLHETCGRVGICNAGIEGQPCNSSEECLPFHECLNSICHDARPLEGLPATLDDLLVCFVNANSLPTPDLIELPTWLIGSVGLVLAVIASRAPQWIMKPKDVQRRTTLFKVFLASSILLWIPYFILAVIDQVMAQRELSHIGNDFQALGKCFEADSAISEELRTSSEQVLKEFRILTVGFLCEVIAVIVFTLATFLLLWRYLQECPSQTLHVHWKKVILIGLAVVAVGLTAMFVGAKTANERRQFPNRYCEIVKSFGNEYVTCALSTGNTFEVLGESFSEEAINICSQMTLQSIQTGNISSLTLEEHVRLALQFTTSLEVAFEVLAYEVISRILVVLYSLFDLLGSVLLRIWLAFVFLKVIFELILSFLLNRLPAMSKKVFVLTVIIAILLVICELVVQISRSTHRAGIDLLLQGPNVAIICGSLVQGSESNGVLDRSFSTEASDVLIAFTTFLFVAISFKELFTATFKNNEAVDDQKNSTGTNIKSLER